MAVALSRRRGLRQYLAQSGGRRRGRQGRHHPRPRLDASRRAAHAETRRSSAPARPRAGRDALRDAGALLPSRQDAALRRRHHPCRDCAWFPRWKIPIPEVAGQGGKSGCARGASRSKLGLAPRRHAVPIPAISGACAKAARRSCSSSRYRRTARPAGPAGGRWRITGEAARERVFLLRAMSDAILVGLGTALSDNPALTCRLPGMMDRSPVRILLDARLQVPLSVALIATARETPTWVFDRFRALPGRRNLRERVSRFSRAGEGRAARSGASAQNSGPARHYPAAGGGRPHRGGVVSDRRSGGRGGTFPLSEWPSGRTASMRWKACRWKG